MFRVYAPFEPLCRLCGLAWLSNLGDGTPAMPGAPFAWDCGVRGAMQRVSSWDCGVRGAMQRVSSWDCGVRGAMQRVSWFAFCWTPRNLGHSYPAMRHRTLSVSPSRCRPASCSGPCGQHGHVHVCAAVWPLSCSLCPRGHRRDAGPGGSSRRY